MHSCTRSRVLDWLLSQMLFHTQGLSHKRDKDAPPCQGEKQLCLPEARRAQLPCSQSSQPQTSQRDDAEVPGHSLPISAPTLSQTAARML